MAAIFYFEDTLDPQWIRRGIYHAGSCVIGLTNNKKPALGGLEKAQTLRSFLMATSDNKPAMMASNQIGLVGTGGSSCDRVGCLVPSREDGPGSGR